jgi:gliding motility-associated-like protein
MYTVTAVSVDSCVSMDSVLVTVNPLPVIDAGPDVTMCDGQETILTASGGVTYLWEPDSGIVGSNTTASVTAAPTGTTTFTVTGVDANGCVGSDMVDVTIQPAPTSDAGLDITIWLGQTTQLVGNHSPTATSWFWSPDLYLVSPSTVIDDVITVQPEVTTTYYFTVADQYGCTATDSVTVIVDPEGDFYMPNAFTPNGDTKNDEFFVVHLGPVNLEYFRIYNRWGRVVFEGTLEGAGNGWDGTFKGKDQPVGVYTYVVKSVSVVDGTERLASGSVTLMR